MAVGFSVESFSSALKTSGARSNLFSVSISGVPSIGDVAIGLSTPSDKTTQLEYLCNATTLPGYNQGEIPISYFGRTVYFAGDTTFGDWTTTIINDEGMPIRRAIESWMEGINSVTGNVRTMGVPHKGLTATAEIKTYSIDGSSEADDKPITKVKLIGVWPSNLSPIELSHDAVNTIETFTCTWQYQHAIHNEVTKKQGG
tara:strand:+ start:2244 stop:2843 length:600 start_codon:yes stop_codon:yes gene_type:complete